MSGATEIYAWVADSNSRAIAFYRKYGFQPTDERQSLPSNTTEWELLLSYAPNGG